VKREQRGREGESRQRWEENRGGWGVQGDGPLSLGLLLLTGAAGSGPGFCVPTLSLSSLDTPA
jgi:hypothetical protein